MRSRHRGRRAALRILLRRALRGGAAAVKRACLALRRREAHVEVVLVDRARCRAIQRDVRVGLRRLRRVLGPALPDGMVVVVQQVVPAGRPPVGRYSTSARLRAGGTRIAPAGRPPVGRYSTSARRRAGGARIVPAGRPLVGCYEVADRPDGRRVVFVRLALSVDGRRLGINEVLAALADQCIAIARIERSEPVVRATSAR